MFIYFLFYHFSLILHLFYSLQPVETIGAAIVIAIFLFKGLVLKKFDIVMISLMIEMIK